MKIQKILQTIIIWLPSFVIAIIFILNGIDKIFNSTGMDKVIQNEAVIITVGIILLVATTLFLYPKTILYGTFILASYMTMITLIHIYKGKPFEVVALIVVGTVFAGYLRNREMFKNFELTSNHQS